MSGADVRAAVAAAIATLLGSLALRPVYLTGAWFPPVLATVCVVLAAGLALRAGGTALWSRASGGRRVPAGLAALAVPVVPMAQLALVGWLLTALYAPGTARAGMFPTAAGVRRVVDVLHDGAAELREQSTPALPLHGLLALTVVLVGLVAVAVDLLAVAGGQAGLAAPGLLVLFCVPVTTITGGVGLTALVGPAVGLVVLLWADQRRRLARSGALPRPASGGAGWRAVQVGGAALLAGVVLGGVVPTFAEGTWGAASGAGPLAAGGAGSTGRSLDPVAVMHGELTLSKPVDLLRVHTSVDDPGYLRAVALEQYDTAHGWTLGNLAGDRSIAGDPALATVPPREVTRQVTETIQAIGHDDRFLPLPYAPQSVTVRGAPASAWRFDPATATVFGRNVTTHGRTYTVTAREPRPTVALLERAPEAVPDSAELYRDTVLPPVDPGIPTLVDSLTRGARTAYDRVRAIDAYFTDPANGFTYSLSTKPGTTGDDLKDFLTGKRGYCEQYAGAMAVLARAAGIPARVVLGYTPGTVQPDGTRLITSSDAHAWVEAYFADLGWVPFDPTPAAASRATPLPWAPRATPEDTPTAQDSAPAAAPSSAPHPSRLEKETPYVPVRAPRPAGTGWVRPALLGLGATLAVGLLVGLPGLLRARQRRRRLAEGSASALWDELAATARDLGMSWPPTRTPRQAARELAHALDRGRSARASTAAGAAGAAGAVAAVRQLALAEEAASYAGPTADATATEPLRAALRTARRALRRSVPRRTRLRSLLWPASSMGRAPWGRVRWGTVGRTVRSRLPVLAGRRSRSA